MTKLIETDEEVEKAGLRPPGGSKGASRRAFIAARLGGAASSLTRRGVGTKALEASGKLSRRVKVAAYLESRAKRVRKSTNAPTALEALDEAIEKARGLLPKGGSSKLRNRIWDRREKLANKLGFDGAKGRRMGRATRYLASRHKGGRSGAPNGAGAIRTSGKYK